MVNGYLIVLGNLQGYPCLLLGSRMHFQQDSPDFCLFLILLYPAEPDLEKLPLLRSALACTFHLLRSDNHEVFPLSLVLPTFLPSLLVSIPAK